MGEISYSEFIQELDARLDFYFRSQSEFICCKKGCSLCCETGDYPMSDLELKYLMKGYSLVDNNIKIKIQENIKNLKRGGKCPFLIDSVCSVYDFRPIICRVHGLAYVKKNNPVNVPHCANLNLNYSKVYTNGILSAEPIIENLDTQTLLKDMKFGEIRNLYDWIKSD